MPRAYRCDGVAGRGEILKFRRTTIALLPLVAIAASWISASAQHPPAAQESPWATRAPAASATGATSQVKVLHPEASITPAQRAFAKKYLVCRLLLDKEKMRALIPHDT